MKKIILIFISIAVFLTSCTAAENKDSIKTSVADLDNSKNSYRVSVWIAYYELENLICESEDEFFELISEKFSYLSSCGFNTVTVQVRPYADAFYKSEYFPSSKYCFGKEGGEMQYDPLKVMCSAARANSLSIEAWINPYRAGGENKFKNLSESNIAKKWYDSGKTDNVIKTKSGIYFNPASDDVTKLIVNGVNEIVENYSVSAIHFDDYFYPSTDKEIDKTSYSKYKDSGGKLSLYEWRRNNIDNMVKSVYKSIKKINPDVQFGISPASDMQNNYDELYADTEKWAAEDGFVDYICPQIYFGFKNEKQPFMQTVKKWNKLTKKQLYIGLPLYKCSKSDKYASSDNEDAINEFKNNSNIISRQIKYLSKTDGIDGFYIFSYGFIFDDSLKSEVSSMIKTIKEVCNR